MFKIKTAATFTHDVPIMVPVDGGYEERTLKTTFNFVDTDEVEKYSMRDYAQTTEFLKLIVDKLHDLADEGGASIAYSDEVRDQLFKKQYVRVGLCTYYFGAVTKAKAGN